MEGAPRHYAHQAHDFDQETYSSIREMSTSLIASARRSMDEKTMHMLFVGNISRKFRFLLTLTHEIVSPVSLSERIIGAGHPCSSFIFIIQQNSLIRHKIPGSTITIDMIPSTRTLGARVFKTS